MARTHSARRWARQPSQQMHIAKDNSNLSRLMPNMHTGALNASARLQRKKNTWRYYSLDGLIVDCDNTIRLAPHHWSDAELISWHVNKVFDLFAFDRSTHKAFLSIRTKNRHVPRNGKLRTCIIYALTASFFNHLNQLTNYQQDTDVFLTSAAAFYPSIYCWLPCILTFGIETHVMV